MIFIGLITIYKNKVAIKSVTLLQKHQAKTMSKSTRKTLQASIRAMDMNVLVGEVVTALRKQCFDGSLATLVNKLCESKHLLQEMVDYHHNMFTQLYSDYKKEKNSQIRFKVGLLLQ